MAVIPIYIPTYISDQTYKPARVLPRLLFYNGQVECEPYYVQNQLANQFEQSTFPYFDNFNVVTGSFPTINSNSLLFYNENAVYGQTPTASLYSEYWSNYLNLLYNPLTKLINASAIIPLADYRELKQNDIVEFRSNYYHLRAINDYNLKNGECTLQLLGPILADALDLPTHLFYKCFGYDVSDCDVACTDADLCNPTTTTTTTSTSTTSTTSTSTTSTTSTSTTSTTSTSTTSTSTSTSTSTTTTFGPLVIDYIIVGGGGSGGGKSTEVGSLYDDVWPGGGGGGQVISGSMTVTTQLIVGVGEGGQNTFYYNDGTLLPNDSVGGYASGSRGSKGFPSYISGSGINQTAIGGGQGGTTDWNFGGDAIPVKLDTNGTFTGVHCDGGNGGGAALVSGGLATYITFSGGAPAAGGFYGASSTGSIGSPFNYGNTGGGGAGASQNAIGGNGGAGCQWLDADYYAGGGGGFIRKVSTLPYPSVYEAGSGGAGGGGGYNTDGFGNSGGGGGGSRSAQYPANGAKGVVKIRYIGTTVRATGGTITQSGGYTYHTFTSSLSGGVYIVGAVSSSAGITGGTYMYQTYISGALAYSASFTPL